MRLIYFLTVISIVLQEALGVFNVTPKLYEFSNNNNNTIKELHKNLRKRRRAYPINNNNNHFFPTRSKHYWSNYNESRQIRHEHVKTRHILAFGDSLTEGFYNHGTLFHPYTIKLSQLLSEKIKKQNEDSDAESKSPPQGTYFNITVEESGIAGERTDHMITRLRETLQDHLKHGRTVNIVAILGGTNDLANHQYPPEHIYARLETMYNMTRQEFHAELVVMTIPQTSFDYHSEAYLKRKTIINDKIKAYYDLNKDIPPRVAYVDLYSKVPFFSTEPKGSSSSSSPATADKMRSGSIDGGEGRDLVKSSNWDDHLHFSPKGYDYMGELVFRALSEQLLI